MAYGAHTATKPRGTYSKVACNYCRLRKKKCNAVSPCDQCVGTSREQGCQLMDIHSWRRARVALKEQKPKRSRGRPRAVQSDKDPPTGSSSDYNSEESDKTRSSSAGLSADQQSELLRWEDTALRSYSRRYALTVYTSKVAPISVPWVGYLYNAERLIQSDYDELWGAGGSDIGLAYCNAVYCSMAMASLGDTQSCNPLIQTAGRGLLRLMRSRPPTLSGGMALYLVARFFSFNQPQLSRDFGVAALEILPSVAELSTPEMKNENNQLTDLCNMVIQMSSPAETFSNTITFAFRSEDELMRAADDLEMNGSVGEVERAIWAARGGMAFLMPRGAVMLLGGRVIARVDKSLRIHSTVPAVRWYGLLNCMVPPCDIEPHPHPCDANGTPMTCKGIMGMLRSHFHLVQAIVKATNRVQEGTGEYVFETMFRRRYGGLSDQYLFTCRTMTIVVLWWSGDRTLAIEMMNEFLRQTFDYSWGFPGSYIYPLAMLLEVAIDSDDVNLVAMVTEQIVKRARTPTAVPDQRKTDLAVVAQSWLESMSEPKS